MTIGVLELVHVPPPDVSPSVLDRNGRVIHYLGPAAQPCVWCGGWIAPSSYEQIPSAVLLHNRSQQHQASTFVRHRGEGR